MEIVKKHRATDTLLHILVTFMITVGLYTFLHARVVADIKAELKQTQIHLEITALKLVIAVNESSIFKTGGVKGYEGEDGSYTKIGLCDTEYGCDTWNISHRIEATKLLKWEPVDISLYPDVEE